MADVVEPALRARVAGRGEQLDGLEPLAAQEAPQLGVADVQVPWRRSKPPAAATTMSRSLAPEPELVEAGGERFARDRRAARGEREQAGPARSASQVDREALAQQRAAQAVALQQRQRRAAARAAAAAARCRARSPRDGRRSSAGSISASVSGSGANSEPRGVADEPQHPRRVVDERALVQHPQHAVPRGPRARPATRCASPSSEATAIALTVKSRRARSSSIVAPSSTSGSAPGRG